MKDEIKGILDVLNRMAKENKESDNPLQATVILYEILYKVLDYITNLQEENETKEKENVYLDSEIGRLKEKNKKIHKELDYANNDNIYYIAKIDKAINYINRCRDYHKTYHNEDKMFADELTSLIMVLQGDDKE